MNDSLLLILTKRHTLCISTFIIDDLLHRLLQKKISLTSSTVDPAFTCSLKYVWKYKTFSYHKVQKTHFPWDTIRLNLILETLKYTEIVWSQ